MNKQIKTFLISLGLILLLTFSVGTASAFGGGKDKVVFGSSYELSNGETLNGSLMVIGGDVNIDKGASVTGDVAIFGGSLNIDGKISGNVATFGGNILLGSTAQVDGDFASFGGNIVKDPGATISGDSLRQDAEKFINPDNFTFNTDRFEEIGEHRPSMNIFASAFSIFMQIALFFATLLIIAAIALIVNMLFEKQLDGVGKTLIDNPLNALGIGLAVIVALPFVLVFFSITVILIPVALIIALIFGVLAVYGWIAAGAEVGRRLTKSMKVSWSSNWVTAFGTFILTLVMFLFEKIIPCIGWIPDLFVMIVGLGAVVNYHVHQYQNRSGNKTQFLTSEVPYSDKIPSDGVIAQSSAEEKTARAGEVVARGAVDVAATAEGGITEFLDRSAQAAENAGSTVATAKDDVKGAASDVTDELHDVAADIQKGVKGVVDEGSDALQDAAEETAQDAAEEAIKDVKDAVSNVAEELHDKTEKPHGIGASFLDSIHKDLEDDSEKKE